MEPMKEPMGVLLTPTMTVLLENILLAAVVVLNICSSFAFVIVLRFLFIIFIS